jgi:hypothetical protein
MGGFWSDALEENGARRAAGIDHRCDVVLHDIGFSAQATPGHHSPTTHEDGYYALRAVEPYVVDMIADEVVARAAKSPYERERSRDLVAFLRAVASAARETIHARRAADLVKSDLVGKPMTPAYAADKARAAAELEARTGIDGLFQVDAGPYTDEARAIGLLTALDRMEIARGLPKHLKIYTVRAGFSNVFHVDAPAVSAVPESPIATGTWLAYLTEVAAAAAHPVPSDARDPQNREPLAWTGILAGFADRMRADAVQIADVPELGDVEYAVASRLDEQYSGERQRYEAHAAEDR